MQTQKPRNKFSVLLPQDERYFLKSQDKSFREKYYMYVFSKHKKGETPINPIAYYHQRVSLGLKPFKEIAESLNMEVGQVKTIYNQAMTKIRNALL